VTMVVLGGFTVRIMAMITGRPVARTEL
jgi:hypothetical protein